ncbi:MAG TPA: hypothetical protein VFZ66_22990, partial [Herpetosiphonaceae bacterium]
MSTKHQRTPTEQNRMPTHHVRPESGQTDHLSDMERTDGATSIVTQPERLHHVHQPQQQSALRQAQQTYGNQHVQRLVSQAPTIRREAVKGAPTNSGPNPEQIQRETETQLGADELTTRIARCIGIWETNRGKDDPAPKESSLDTVAGVAASMATIEQATMPYAVTALKNHKSLRDKANPPLTMKELNAAEARCNAVVKLLTLVGSAAAQDTQPDDFIQNHAAAIAATGLSNDDVKTMFSAVGLKATIDAANVTVKSKKKKTADLIDAIPEAERLGLGRGSLKAYIEKPVKWGENRAAWQRKAVAAMPDNIGARIEAVAVSDTGTGLAIPVIRARVNTELAKKPVPSEVEIVKTVAQQNNPNEANYGQHV